MNDSLEKICIIGAGPGGLAAIKSCLEHGLTPSCYEMTAKIGGLWNTTERKRMDLSPQMYDDLMANISKHASSFSDFPPLQEMPPFMSQEQTLEYLRMYADHFQLTDYITFNTEILSVREACSCNDSVPGHGCKWVIRMKSLESGIESEEQYDSVIIATGSQGEQIKPNIPGLYDKFRGQIMYSGKFNGGEELREKSIVIIGAGHSGCDIACICSGFSKDVYLSARNGTWIIPRISTNGVPFDLIVVNRFKLAMNRIVPSWLSVRMITGVLEARMNHAACGIKSRYPPNSFQASVAMNDLLPNKLYGGLVKSRPGVERFDEDTVTFVDGQTQKVDVVIVATGYASRYPFLSEEIVACEEEKRKMHFWIFPFNIKRPSSLAFVGLIPNGNGPVFTTLELQSRFVAQILSRKRKLPSKSIMEKICEKEKHDIRQLTGGKYLFKTSFVKYRESLADHLGLKPSFLRLLFTDPKLAFNVLFGPLVPYHYRLTGPGKWDKARQYSLDSVKNALSGMTKSSVS